MFPVVVKGDANGGPPREGCSLPISSPTAHGRRL